MYEERKKLSIRDIVIQLLLVVLFVLILIWLFPTKGYLENNYVQKGDNDISDQLQALYGRLFADNVDTMKNAAKDYFTTPRLPKNVGDSVTLTLGDMLDKKMVLPFKDSNNQSCDATKSYVQLTKMDDEYQMKVQLTCSDYSDYIIAYMGCYSYCEGSICETKKPETSTNTKPDNPKPQPTTKTTQYEYEKTWGNDFSNWGPWSEWSTTVRNVDNLTQVEKELRTINTGGGSSTGTCSRRVPYQVAYQESYTAYRSETTRIPTGTYTEIPKNVLVDSQPQKTTTSQGSYGSWYSAGTTKTTNQVLYSTNTVRYTLRSTDKVLNCNNSCVYDTIRVYAVEKRSYTAGGSTPVPCTTSYGSGYKLENGKCNKYETQFVKVPDTKEVVTQVPYTAYRTAYRTEYKTEYYSCSVDNGPNYEDIMYYRYRTRTQTVWAGRDLKWSKSNNDSSLISQGYKLTGNTREV